MAGYSLPPSSNDEHNPLHLVSGMSARERRVRFIRLTKPAHTPGSRAYEIFRRELESLEVNAEVP